MRALFTITTKGKPFEAELCLHPTDMLMLTKLNGVPLGPGPRAIDNLLGGGLTQKIESQDFLGDVGQHIHVRMMDGHPQTNILLVGLGSPTQFNPCSLFEVIHAAVLEAVKHECSKLTIPLVAKRLTALNLNLRGTAHIIRRSAERTLQRLPGDQTLEIEFVCIAPARRHLQVGLDILDRTNPKCCQDED